MTENAQFSFIAVPKVRKKVVLFFQKACLVPPQVFWKGILLTAVFLKPPLKVLEMLGSEECLSWSQVLQVSVLIL